MCGIWIAIKKIKNIYEDHTKYKNNIKPRGPDKTIEGNNDNFEYAFHRLAIEDLSENGDQPFIKETEDRIIYVFCNGEIYNHKQIATKYNYTKFKSESDCEKLVPLYLEYSDGTSSDNNLNNLKTFCNELVAEFACVIIDINKKTNNMLVFMSQDHLGMRPLFIGENDSYLYISSQLNGIPNNRLKYIHRAEPRRIILYEFNITNTISNYVINIKTTDYKKFESIDEKTKKYIEENHKFFIDENEVLKNKIHEIIGEKPTDEFKLIKWMIAKLLIDSAYIRNHSCRKKCALSSGGLDSGLVVGILSLLSKLTDGSKLNTFNIGFAESTDKPFADLLAKYVDSNHTFAEGNISECLNIIKKVIETIGSFDITTVRASVMQYLVASCVSTTDNKVVFCGEISDELCTGYKYHKNAENPHISHIENIYLLNFIHLFDGLRVDRCMANFGLESRFIFGDQTFVDYYLSCPYELRVPKNGVEKWLLRESFRGLNIIPDEILFRPKEAFSDSVSSHDKSWYQIIQDYVDKIYTNDDFNKLKLKYNYLQPVSKESLYYREIFCEYYDDSYSKTIPHFWLPKWAGDIKEPSARVL